MVTSRQLLLIPFLLSGFFATGQHVASMQVNNFSVTQIMDTEGGRYDLNKPLVSYEINKIQYQSAIEGKVELSFSYELLADRGLKGTLQFKNISDDTLSLSNILPFGNEQNEVFITGLGNHRLSRTHLFLPGRKPVNVIVPDNAWELGYSGFSLNHQQKLFGLARRDLNSLKLATRKRFESIIAPGGSVSYHVYIDLYQGEWQQGLREVFQKRYLYDISQFDESLYNRADLSWIRKGYVMHLLMAWDKEFYDSKDGRHHLQDFIRKGKQLYGGDDVICIWPTWPTLGVDSRNQFDLYRDLPGGLVQLRTMADSARSLGTKFFVAYNPWDESTRSEGHLQGLSGLIKETSADGIVLDTKGESSRELQDAADNVKSGVVMYSEGMAVPKDMPGIISGRVHNALYYPPMLNLNKFIRPDFAIFRVAEVYKELIQREYAVAFFNGYGTEINQFAPGHPHWEEEQYRYLGNTTRILRENSNVFNSDYTPLHKTSRDSIWVNAWKGKSKTIYTILSMKPEGFHAPLFEMTDTSDHWIDIWKHEEVKRKMVSGKPFAIVNVDGFDSRFLGTNNEGEVSCVARFSPSLNNLKLSASHLLSGTAVSGKEIRIWKGNPTYESQPLIIQLQHSKFEISIPKLLGRYEGKLVIQLFEEDQIIDEQIMFLTPGTPRLISETTNTNPQKISATNMSLIPAGKLKVHYTQGDEFIPYPKYHLGEWVPMKSFAMDKFPVTNKEFKIFLQQSGYVPADTARFLAHWVKGEIPVGQENFPVTYVSLEDATAYAHWAGKRLPSELEWQYAAQTESGNEWPWKQQKPVTRKETYVTETLTVKNIEGIDPKNCNLGDGKLYPVGKYKKGVNSNGLSDLVGCVWQLTNDVYESGSYRYVIMKGGSYFKPSSSWWYVQGGPRELHYRQYLLRVSPGFERNETVGFRCVQDVQ